MFIQHKNKVNRTEAAQINESNKKLLLETKVENKEKQQKRSPWGPKGKRKTEQNGDRKS